MALLVERPWLDRVIVLLSAAPIAIVANVVRIAVTTLAYQYVGREVGDFIFHDLAGWLMMPIALASHPADEDRIRYFREWTPER